MRLFRTIYGCWFTFNFIWVFLLLLPFFLITLSTPSLYKYAHKLRVLWGRIILLLGFIWVKVYNKKLVDRNKKYIIVSNHASHFDIISIAVGVPLDLNFMAKIQLQRIPVFGIFFKTIDIAVDRSSAAHSAKAYMNAKDQLKNNVRSICIFPEGGIKPISPKVSPFKQGAFKMAVETQTTILPVSIFDNWKLSSSIAFEAQPGLMRIYIHEPIDTQGKTLDDVKSLCDITYQIIKQKVEENI
ncbi:MAG: lysophospholipid acyltransferase family protein [Bacteroidota bacterium]|nr:lysophospholipid acyltransferase family protein [Bacteroidota bacterium]